MKTRDALAHGLAQSQAETVQWLRVKFGDRWFTPAQVLARVIGSRSATFRDISGDVPSADDVFDELRGLTRAGIEFDGIKRFRVTTPQVSIQAASTR